MCIPIEVQVFMPVSRGHVWPAITEELAPELPSIIREACARCDPCPACDEFDINYMMCGFNRETIDAHIWGLKQLPRGARVQQTLIEIGNRLRSHIGMLPITMNDMDLGGIPLAFAERGQELQ